MARLYLDHNVSLRLVASLRSVGHDVVAARDLNITRVSDDAQVLAAVRAGRLLITHNRRDFLLLHEAWITWPAAFGMALPPHAGMLLLDVASPNELVRVLIALLTTTPLSELADNCLWWHRTDGWLRRLVRIEWESFAVSPDAGPNV